MNGKCTQKQQRDLTETRERVKKQITGTKWQYEICFDNLLHWMFIIAIAYAISATKSIETDGRWLSLIVMHNAHARRGSNMPVTIVWGTFRFSSPFSFRLVSPIKWNALQLVRKSLNFQSIVEVSRGVTRVTFTIQMQRAWNVECILNKITMRLTVFSVQRVHHHKSHYLVGNIIISWRRRRLKQPEKCTMQIEDVPATIHGFPPIALHAF